MAENWIQGMNRLTGPAPCQCSITGSHQSDNPHCSRNAKAGPWSVVALLRKPGEPRASYAVRRVVWTACEPTSEYLPRNFGPDDYKDACAEAQRLNGAAGVRATVEASDRKAAK